MGTRGAPSPRTIHSARLCTFGHAVSTCAISSTGRHWRRMWCTQGPKRCSRSVSSAPASRSLGSSPRGRADADLKMSKALTRSPRRENGLRSSPEVGCPYTAGAPRARRPSVLHGKAPAQTYIFGQSTSSYDWLCTFHVRNRRATSKMVGRDLGKANAAIWKISRSSSNGRLG